MLHTEFLGNRSTGTGEDCFDVFLHIWAWWPSWSCDQYHVIKCSFQMYLKAYKIWLKWPSGF